MRSWVWGAILATTAVGCDNDPIITARNPTIESFTASETIVARGSSVVLAWKVLDSNEIEIRATPSGSVLASTDQSSGSIVSPPINEATTFTITARAGTRMAEASVSVMVEAGEPPTILSFAPVRGAIQIGESAELLWRVDGAEQISLATAGGFVLLESAPREGSLTVTPVETTSYVLSVSNPFGSETATATITVNEIDAPVINAFTVNPTSITVGSTSTITWDVSGADHVIISDGVTSFESENASGTLIVSPLRSSIYTLTAIGARGQIARSSATVTVQPGPPRILSCELSPNPAPAGGTISITWQATDAAEVRVLRESTEIFRSTTDANLGNVETQLDQSGTYLLELTSPYGANTCSWYVRVHEAPIVDNFVADLNVLSAGNYEVTIEWRVRNVAHFDLLADGVSVPSFPRIDALDTTDSSGSFTFTTGTAQIELVAESAGGSEVRRAVVGIPEMEPNAPVAQAQVLPQAEALLVIANLDNTTEDDWFEVQVPAGGSLYVDASLGDTCGGDTFIYLYRAPNSSSTILTDSSDSVGNCARIDPATDSAVRNMAGGTYWIRIDADASAGPYMLDIRIYPPNTCGDRIRSGSEECDGEPVCGNDCRLVVEGELSTSGAATMTFSGTVVGADEHLYRLTVGQRVALEADLFSPVSGVCGTGDLEMSLRLDLTTQLAVGQPAGNSCSHLDANSIVIDPGTYYIRIRNRLAEPIDTLDYVLSLQVIELGGCGNAVLDVDEQCDDGNMVSGDGCSACTFEVGPGRTINLPMSGSVDHFGSIEQVGAFHVYRIEVTTSTTYLSAHTFSPQFGACDIDASLVLWARDAATGVYSILRQTTGAGCGSIVPPSLRLPPGTYFLQVLPTSGGALPSYGLRVAGAAVDVCGNGFAEPGEECDDGNTQSGDACSSTCTLEAESCTSGVVVPRTGLRHVGSDFTVFADDLVLPTACTERPGMQSEAVFQVDLMANDTLRVVEAGSLDAVVTLQRGACGTGECVYSLDSPENFTYFTPTAETVWVIIEAWFEAPSSRAFDITIEIIPEVCGDGIAVANEECDDGNLDDGDGCSSTCQVTAESCASYPLISSDYRMAGTIWNRAANDFNLPSAGCTVRSGREDLLFGVVLEPGQRVLARELGQSDVTVSILQGATCAQALAGMCTVSTATEDVGAQYANNTGTTETVFVVFEPDLTSDSAEPYDIEILVR